MDKKAGEFWQRFKVKEIIFHTFFITPIFLHFCFLPFFPNDIRKPYPEGSSSSKKKKNIFYLYRIFYLGRRSFPPVLNFILSSCQICFINMRIYSSIYFCGLPYTFLRSMYFLRILFTFLFLPVIFEYSSKRNVLILLYHDYLLNYYSR